MSLVRLILNSNGTAADFKSQSPLAVGGLNAINNFASYLEGLVGGMQAGASFAFQVGAVKASGTITQTSTGAANGQTGTICGITFTARTSGAVGNEWNRNNNVTTSAAALAAAINASTDLAGIVTATSLLGVVTLTAVSPGLIGNGLVMASVNWANTTVASFSGGLDGTAYSIDLR